MGATVKPTRLQAVFERCDSLSARVLWRSDGLRDVPPTGGELSGSGVGAVPESGVIAGDYAEGREVVGKSRASAAYS
jgi:hypothetical protein